MAKKEYNRAVHCVYNLSYHLIWCPKYRRKVLINGVDERLKELIHIKCTQKGWIVKQLEVMPDHVHLFVSATPNDSPKDIVAAIKGFSSRYLRSEYPWLYSRLPNLWTRSYFAESVGHISEETIKKYIENQKNV